jgi:outer membrane protein assembly factor BamB
MQLDVVWSINGPWSAVAANPTNGEIYAIKNRGQLWHLDRDGKQIETFSLELSGLIEGSILRLANVTGDTTPELVVASHWDKVVRVFNAKGTLLWQYAAGDSVDDIWTADLDVKQSDGFEEVLIGYNGSGGLHALNSDGTLRWKNTAVGNVWHVRVGATAPDGATEAFTPGRGPKRVCVFDAAGAKVRDLNVIHDPTLVLLAQTDPKARPIVITSDSPQATIAATNLDGTSLWHISLPTGRRSTVCDGLTSPDQPWFVVSLYDGRTLVYDTRTGDRLASMKARGMPASLAWIPASGDLSPLLVTATGGTLTARVLKPLPGEQPSDIKPTPK